MQVRKDKKKKRKKKKIPVPYENIPQVPTLFIIYIQPLTLHCINTLQLKHCRQVSLEKQKHDSNINKAEHGYNIGMHAVDKTSCKQHIKTKQGLLVRLNMIS